ncbi:hypothetical protein ACVWZ6_001244 [Bradyrhizobium sp. GM6.1]
MASWIEAPKPPRLGRDHDAEQLLLTRNLESLVGEAGIAIDPVCVGSRHGGGAGGALNERGTMLEKARLRLVDSEDCFTHVHIVRLRFAVQDRRHHSRCRLSDSFDHLCL